MADLGLPDARRVTFTGDWHARPATLSSDLVGRGVGEVVLHTGDFAYLFRDGYLDLTTTASNRCGHGSSYLPARTALGVGRAAFWH